MPLVGVQNPWIAAAGGANQGANELAQTLLRLPLVRQQLQQGALQNQLLQGQVQFQPQQQQAQLGLLGARTGAEKARGSLYGSEQGKYDAQTAQIKDQSAGLDALKETVAKVMSEANNNNGQVSPATQAEWVQAASRLPPNVMKQITQILDQGLQQGKLGSPETRLAIALGNKQVGVNVPANSIFHQFTGGPDVQGNYKTGPGQQIVSPQTGQPLATNPNVGGSKSSALDSRALAIVAQNHPEYSIDQIAQAAKDIVAKMTSTNQPASIGTNAQYIWTPQGLVPKQ